MPIPYAGIYRDQQSAAQLAYDQSIAKLNMDRGSLFRQYGLQADVNDSTGAVSNVRTDTANPYGAIQTLKHRQGGELNKAWDMASERRIGHRGLGAQQESELRYAHGGEDMALGQNFLGAHAGNYQARLDAEAARASLFRQAELSALQAAEEGEMFTQAEGPGAATEYTAPWYQPTQQQIDVAKAYNMPSVKAAFKPGGMNPAIAAAAHRKAIAAAASKPAPARKPAAPVYIPPAPKPPKKKK